MRLSFVSWFQAPLKALVKDPSGGCHLQVLLGLLAELGAVLDLGPQFQGLWFKAFPISGQIGLSTGQLIASCQGVGDRGLEGAGCMDSWL